MLTITILTSHLEQNLLNVVGSVLNSFSISCNPRPDPTQTISFKSPNGIFFGGEREASL